MKKILCIDDEPALLQLFDAALSLKDYKVYATAKLSEGLQTLESHDIALILLDIHLPDRDGFSIYHELRTRCKTPILFVTGDSKAFAQEQKGDPPPWVAEMSNGTAGVLYKPFDIHTLFDQVERLIGSQIPQPSPEPH